MQFNHNHHRFHLPTTNNTSFSLYLYDYVYTWHIWYICDLYNIRVKELPFDWPTIEVNSDFSERNTWCLVYFTMCFFLLVFHTLGSRFYRSRRVARRYSLFCGAEPSPLSSPSLPNPISQALSLYFILSFFSLWIAYSERKLDEEKERNKKHTTGKS